MEKPPIFIIGCPRSGTTLVRVILDSHPNICCGPETHMFRDIEKFRKNILHRWNMLQPYGVDKKAINQKLKEFFLLFTENYVSTKKKKRWAEKTPDHIFYVDLIDELFPDCQFINVIRDGRDVVCSYKERWGRKTFFNAIKTWNKTINLTLIYRKKFDKKRYMEIRYEDLISNPEMETRKMMKFIGEEWTPVLLEHHKIEHDFWFKQHGKTQGHTSHDSREKHPMRHTPSQPIFSSSVGRWKKKLNLIEKILVNILLRENLIKMGYMDKKRERIKG
ncbi:MAG: hypothetical protein DRN08_01535 [Thermoplasmata archaeon]|nr:MAG: hypothetical protein DRN05_05170 [Thermoplasmata archaeon]RLF36331.1 MAG: hypothetical protein DRN08_01535 [Thermoplasmata archaeon]